MYPALYMICKILAPFNELYGCAHASGIQVPLSKLGTSPEILGGLF